MEIETIATGVLSFIGGGGLAAVLTLGSVRKKAKVEVKTDEIKALHDTIESVYEPLVEQLRRRVAEQDNEIASLRKQLSDEREARQREMKLMNERILAITSAIGLNTRDYIRNNKGQFTAKPEENEA